MILVQFEGGLGNQMFQYAFGRACSLRLKEALFLDLKWYRKKNSKRKFLLSEMDIHADDYSKNPLYTKLLRAIKRPVVLKDNGFFEGKNLEPHPNTLLRGWWESSKYFDDAAETIKKEFTLKRPSERFLTLSRDISKDSIAIHIRRGDFLVLNDRCKNGLDYCTKAVEYIVRTKNLKDPQITIFSDDPEWCKKELGILAGHPTKTFGEKLGSDTEELMLMSLYGNNVIANSTFSWWSAYLNKNPQKVVVMPKNWYMDPEKNERYLAGIRVPEWIEIG